MTRYSSGAMEVYDQIFIHTNEQQARNIIETLEGPLDIAFGKYCLLFHLYTFQKTNEAIILLQEIIDLNVDLQDDVLQFYIALTQYLFDIRTHRLDQERFSSRESELRSIYKLLIYYDDWEKFFITGLYYQAISITKIREEAIQGLNKSIESYGKMPKYGIYMANRKTQKLADLYTSLGEFELAEQQYMICFEGLQDYENLYFALVLDGLSSLHVMKDEIVQAIELQQKILDIGTRLENSWFLIRASATLAHLYYTQGNFEHSLQFHIRSRDYSYMHQDPLYIHISEFNIFWFYYHRYKGLKDGQDLKMAKESLELLKESNDKDDLNINNLTTYARSLIDKLGPYKKKAQAMTNLQKLSFMMPSNLSIKLAYLDFLFEDTMQCDDAEPISQIDGLMVQVASIPIHFTPHTIKLYTDQQIILAKYEYFIKINREKAVEYLLKAREVAKRYILHHLVEKISSELSRLEEGDVSSPSLKERIRVSGIQDCIKNAVENNPVNHENSNYA
ncbi:MAG: hypothetical protein INQ03_12380 [Candidatus Heimdallarchaeota archaeon]|nr:hypothetical protein [Candidatus Heimdallarchaeota archaeon]